MSQTPYIVPHRKQFWPEIRRTEVFCYKLGKIDN